jgi:fluoroacetyl-CoA thioesterase
MPVTVGMKGRAETVVIQENTAAAVGSGLVPVFATPYMVALMENAAVNAVQPAMEENQGTVGTVLNITHDAATPIGMKVWAEAEVTAVEGRKITLSVQAFDECGPIGSGVHERFVITVDRFLAKAQAKKAEG